MRFHSHFFLKKRMDIARCTWKPASKRVRRCYTVCMFWQRIGWKSALLLCAAVCALALPSVVMVKQAQAGELLQMLCTVEGKKAVAGTTASHDCMQCCAGSAPAPAPVALAAALHGVHYAVPCTSSFPTRFLTPHTSHPRPPARL
jgi:hypothetical protein